MKSYPFAVYTADHGLEWNYEKGTIGYGELDYCRKAFGRLPDFDAGDPGFEGVIIERERVFAVRCQNVKARDFRGRDATYISVAWVSRSEAAETDFEALLATREMTVPLKAFPASFTAPVGRSLPVEEEGLPRTLADFRAAGSLAERMNDRQTAVLKRIIGERSISCRYKEISAPVSSFAESRLRAARQLQSEKGNNVPFPPSATPPAAMPECRKPSRSAHRLMFVVFVISLLLNLVQALVIFTLIFFGTVKIHLFPFSLLKDQKPVSTNSVDVAGSNVTAQVTGKEAATNSVHVAGSNVTDRVTGKEAATNSVHVAGNNVTNRVTNKNTATGSGTDTGSNKTAQKQDTSPEKSPASVTPDEKHQQDAQGVKKTKPKAKESPKSNKKPAPKSDQKKSDSGEKHE